MALDRANHVDPVQQFTLSAQGGAAVHRMAQLCETHYLQKMQSMTIASLHQSHAHSIFKEPMTVLLRIVLAGANDLRHREQLVR